MTKCGRDQGPGETNGWTILLRKKLVPLGWVRPAGEGLFEWSRSFRDLLFEMADFLRLEELPPEDAAAEFVLKESGSRLLKDFSLPEIATLFKKAQEFGLDARLRDSVRSPKPPAALRSLHEQARGRE